MPSASPHVAAGINLRPCPGARTRPDTSIWRSSAGVPSLDQIGRRSAEQPRLDNDCARQESVEFEASSGRRRRSVHASSRRAGFKSASICQVGPHGSPDGSMGRNAFAAAASISASDKAPQHRLHSPDMLADRAAAGAVTNRKAPASDSAQRVAASEAFRVPDRDRARPK